MASRPINAPVGTMIVPPVFLASSINSGLNKIAPTDKTIAFFEEIRSQPKESRETFYFLNNMIYILSSNN
jgi:hypothetical protein